MKDDAVAPYSTYSARQPPHIAAIARAIRNTTHTHFRTQPLRSPTESAGYYHWFQASLIPGTDNVWTVRRHWQLGPSGKESQAEALSTVCFFDALHYCATHEVSGTLLGMVDAVDATDLHTVPHYREAARAATVPVDDSGLPWPAASGTAFAQDQVFFSPEETAVIKATAAIKLDLSLKDQAELKKILAKNLMSISSSAHDESFKTPPSGDEPPPFKSIKKALEQARELNLVTQKFIEKDYSHGDYTKKPFYIPMAVTGFGCGVGLFCMGGIGLIFGLPVALFAGMAGVRLDSTVLRSNDRQFNWQCAQFKNAVKYLGESEEKKLLTDFARAAATTYKMGFIAHLQAKRKTEKLTGKAADAFNKKAMKLIATVGDSLGASPDNIFRLQEDFKNGEFPAASTFAEALDSDFKALDATIRERMRNRATPG